MFTSGKKRKVQKSSSKTRKHFKFKKKKAFNYFVYDKHIWMFIPFLEFFFSLLFTIQRNSLVSGSPLREILPNVALVRGRIWLGDP